MKSGEQGYAAQAHVIGISEPHPAVLARAKLPVELTEMSNVDFPSIHPNRVLTLKLHDNNLNSNVVNSFTADQFSRNIYLS